MRWWPKRAKVQPTPEPVPLVVEGPAHVLRETVDDSSYVAYSPETELARLVDAVKDVDAYLNFLDLGAESFGEVLRTQHAILNDVTWVRTATSGITDGLPAPMAVFGAFNEIASIFDSLDNEALKGRGTDVRSMSRLLRAALIGAPLARPEPAEPSVWVVYELDAATAMQLRTTNCTGVVATSDLVSGHGVEIATNHGFTCLTGRKDAESVAAGSHIRFCQDDPKPDQSA